MALPTPDPVRCTDRPHGLAAVAAGRAAKRGVVTILSGIAILTAACGSAPTEPTPQSSRVTVPDNVSGLPSDEVQRRLSGLLEPGEPADGGALAAPDVEPTRESEPIPIDDILDALGGGVGEIVISVSPSISQGLAEPVLRIKTPPAHGDAVVLSASQILFVPDSSYSGTNSFEYELLDGDTPVFSAVVELRPPAGGNDDGQEAAP